MERLQLNIRLDGQADLLEAIKEKAKSQGLSINQFVVDALKLALGWIEDRPSVVEETFTDAKLASLVNTMLDEKLTKINERLDYIDKLLDKPLDTQNETLDEVLDKPLDAQNEILDEVLDKPLDSQNEILDEVLDKPLDSQNEILDEVLDKPLDSQSEVLDEPLDKPLDSQSEVLDEPLDKPLDSQSEVLDEPLDKPLDSQSETLDKVLDRPLDAQSNKDHLWVICKVDKLDRDRFSCWTGSFKHGFTDDLNKAQTYQEKSLNRIANKIANSEHAADTSKESILCKTFWDLKRMREATAPEPMPH